MLHQLKCYLPSLLQSAFPFPLIPGDENVMEAILKERLREFFFEGKRWYDLRRFGNQYVLKYTTAQESRLLWPINEDALTNNPALKQTPGY